MTISSAAVHKRPNYVDVDWDEAFDEARGPEPSIDEAGAVAGPEVRADGAGDSWGPDPAGLREGEPTDDRTHAARNAENLAMADHEFDSNSSTDALPALHIGDHVTDRDDDDGAPMIVVGLDTLRADAYELGNGGPTVAAANPDYPEQDDVVEIVFPTGRVWRSTRSATRTRDRGWNSWRRSTIVTAREVRRDAVQRPGLRTHSRSPGRPVVLRRLWDDHGVPLVP